MNVISNSHAMKKIFTIVFLLFLLDTISLRSQRLSRDYEVSLLTNQVGYLPSATKTCLLQASEKNNFEVIEITSGKVAYSGVLVPKPGDFGTYAIADFS